MRGRLRQLASHPFSSSFELVPSFSLLLSLLLLDAQKKQDQSQDVENVEALRGTCFFKMPSGSPARSTSVEYGESVPGTDGSIIRYIENI